MASGKAAKIQESVGSRQSLPSYRAPRYQNIHVADRCSLNTPEFCCPAPSAAAGAACARCGIRWVGVCAALDQNDLGDLGAIMIHRRLDRGQSLLVEGDAAGFAYNVVGGGVKL